MEPACWASGYFKKVKGTLPFPFVTCSEFMWQEYGKKPPSNLLTKDLTGLLIEIRFLKIISFACLDSVLSSQIGVEYLSASAMVKMKNTQTVLLKAIRTVKQQNPCYRLELFLQREAGWTGGMAGGTVCEEWCPLRTWLLFTTPQYRKKHQDSGLDCWISIPRWQRLRSKLYP